MELVSRQLEQFLLTLLELSSKSAHVLVFKKQHNYGPTFNSCEVTIPNMLPEVGQGSCALVLAFISSTEPNAHR